MAGSIDGAGLLRPRGPLSRADLVRALQGDDMLLAGGPVPLEGDLLYLLVRDLREDRAYHAVYAPAEEAGLFTLLGATPVRGATVAGRE